MISVKQVPPGGWAYFEERTKVTLMADTWDNLVKHTKNHRKSNGLPEGEVEKELEEYISKKHPEIVLK